MTQRKGMTGMVLLVPMPGVLVFVILFAENHPGGAGMVMLRFGK